MENWKLETLKIELQKWGEFEGKHTGIVTFIGDKKDAFTFSLSPEETKEFLDLIAKKMVSTASHLGEKLLNSFNLLPAPMTITTELNNNDHA